MVIARASLTIEPLIGRQRELAAAQDALTRSRLVSITGLGGTGKTRLARAVVETIAADIPTWFVDLAAISNAADVPGAVARAVGVGESAIEDIPTAVARSLARGPSLVVLDNFEHVLEARAFVSALLGAAPPLRLIVTSRVRLDIEGELALPLSPLPLPADPSEVETAEASQLFLRRSRARGARIELDSVDAAAVVEICRRLDGLPLALELAAAWTPLLASRAIARRLESGSLELAAPGRQRQASLERVVDATLELVAPEDRAGFAALGLFAGGFDDAAAEAVTGVAPILPLLRRLEAVALITSTPTADGEPRFRMLETIRAVARARLDASGERVASERRFAGHYAVRAQRAADGLRDLSPAPSLAWMTREIANLRTACELATALGDARLAVQLAMTMATYGVRSGSVRESIVRLRAAMALAEVPPGIRSEALNALVNLRYMLGETDGLTEMAREAVELARVAGDERRQALAMIALGGYGPRSEAAEILEAAVAFAERIGYQWAAMAAAENLAAVYGDLGRIRDSLAGLQRVVAIARRVGDEDGASHAQMGIADRLLQLGRTDEALDQASRAVAAIRAAWPESPALAMSLGILAGAQALTGDATTACRTLAEAAGVARAVEADVAREDVLEYAITVLIGEDPGLAARIYGYLETFRFGGETATPPLASAGLVKARAALGVRRLERERLIGRQADPAALVDEVAEAATTTAARRTRLAAEYGTFTGREMDVLDLLAEGRSDQDIADELEISPKTASVHVANIKSKLGVDTRLEAAMRARDLVTIAAPGGRSAGS